MATACAWLVAFGFYVRLVAHDVNPVLAPTLAFVAAIGATALFHLRTLRTHTRSISARRAWFDFAILAVGEWAVCTLTARWVAYHVLRASVAQVFLLTFGAAAVAGSLLRRRLTRDVPAVRSTLTAASERGRASMRDAA